MRVLHIYDVSNYIYIGSWRKTMICRGVKESNGAYVPNQANIGGINFLADKLVYQLQQKEDILLCFDRKPTIKKQMYKEVFGVEEYKGQRKPNYDIFKQKDAAEQLMRECNIPCLAMEGHEADDLIYSAWKTYYDDYDAIRIHTEDSDLAFMCDIKTMICPVKRDRQNITIDTYPFALHKGQTIPYNLSILTKIIDGDPSDKIKGTSHGAAWGQAFVEYAKANQVDPRKLGDIDECRRVLMGMVNMHPELPNADKCLSLLALVTPMLVDISELDQPTNEVNIAALAALRDTRTQLVMFPHLESLLLAYINECMD